VSFRGCTSVGLHPRLRTAAWGLASHADFLVTHWLIDVVCGDAAGNREDAMNRDVLASRGVAFVLNVTSQLANFHPDEFVYERLDVLDSESADIRAHFPRAFEFLERARRSGAACLVHCIAGARRMCYGCRDWCGPWIVWGLLCCAVLCCAVLCCAVLCCAVLCCAVLCCAVLMV
jgi:hypothetical protein